MVREGRGRRTETDGKDRTDLYANAFPSPPINPKGNMLRGLMMREVNGRPLLKPHKHHVNIGFKRGGD